MVVCIVAGGEGTGKTTQMLGICKACEPVVYGILELKDKNAILALETETFKPTVLYKMFLRGEEFQGLEDPIETLKAVSKWRDLIFDMDPLPRTIVLDGISDLRGYSEDALIIRTNRKLVAKGKEPNKAIGKSNIAGWSEVNNMVKEILKPLINLALSEDLNLLFSAQMKDRYMNGEIVGSVPDYKAWISYPIPSLFTLSYNGGGYRIDSNKDPTNPRWFEEGINKETGLLEALKKHGLIDTGPPVFEYMVSGTMPDGEKKRVFVSAETKEAAIEEAAEDNPGIHSVEVTK
jgi:hypothetical protein